MNNDSCITGHCPVEKAQKLAFFGNRREETALSYGIEMTSANGKWLGNTEDEMRSGPLDRNFGTSSQCRKLICFAFLTVQIRLLPITIRSLRPCGHLLKFQQMWENKMQGCRGSLPMRDEQLPIQLQQSESFFVIVHGRPIENIPPGFTAFNTSGSIHDVFIAFFNGLFINEWNEEGRERCREGGGWMRTSKVARSKLG